MDLVLLGWMLPLPLVTEVTMVTIMILLLTINFHWLRSVVVAITMADYLVIMIFVIMINSIEQ